MKKKVLLLGSSQTKHIEKVFSHCGYKVITLQNKNSVFLNRLNLFVNFLKCNILYHVSGLNINESFFFKIALFFRKKVIVHWIGSDVLKFTKTYQERQVGINKNCINLVVSKPLQLELKEIEIESFVVPIFPPDFSCESMDAPKNHSVLSYIPEGREEFYDMELVKKVAEHFSNINFHIVANSGENCSQNQPNIYYHGNLNGDTLKDLYRKCSLLFRFPKHDGLPVMVLEALGYGREVIHCYEFPYVRTPKSRDINDVIDVFEQVFSAPPQKNEDAVEFISHNFSMERQIEFYKDLNIIS